MSDCLYDINSYIIESLEIAKPEHYVIVISERAVDVVSLIDNNFSFKKKSNEQKYHAILKDKSFVITDANTINKINNLFQLIPTENTVTKLDTIKKIQQVSDKIISPCNNIIN